MQEHLFDNTRVVLGRRGHPLGRARSLKDLVDAEWATTSVTFKAEEELRELFEQHQLPAPRLALQSQSALTLMVALANSDLLTMVPVQWTQFAAVDPVAGADPVEGDFPGAVDRDRSPRRPAAHPGG